MRKFPLLVVILLVVVGVIGYFNLDKVKRIQSFFFQPRSSSVQKGVTQSLVNSGNSEENIQVIAENLDIPWEIEFLPSGDLLVTERSGNLVRLKTDSRQAIPVEGVEHIGEGGLMGLALHPQFEENNFLYLYLTTRTDSGLTNRVERYVYDEATNQLSQRRVILENIPGAFVHDGGRLAFGPDGKLYITTGDAGTEESAQDTNSLAGKILRLNDDGSIPSDNPFQNAIYSYGHRNPQGLAWDDQNRLIATEHGPSGTNTGYDEVNFIEKGANYGWPIIKGDQKRDGMRSPVIQSGSEDTWAPGGVTVVRNIVYFAGLRGQALYSAEVQESEGRDMRFGLINLTEHFKEEYGRLRVVKEGPDGSLYLLTSNRDGRGEVKVGDDKIIKVVLTNGTSLE